MSMAIIGAGMAGVSCARVLRDAGIQVQCFDKARGPSGRMASRRHEAGACDHGAQYFTAQDAGFRSQVEQWCQEGVAAVWPGPVGHWQDGSIHADRDSTTRYVGVPRMSALLRSAMGEIPLHSSCQISSMSQDADQQWWLQDTDGQRHGPFAQVLCTAPASQSLALLPEASPLRHDLAQVKMAPCWAMLLWLQDDVSADWQALRLHDHPILDWISREHLRPGREGTPRLVVHARPDWSQEHLEEDREGIGAALQAATEDVLGSSLAVEDRQCHRWRYARPTTCLGRPCVYDPAAGIGLAGDWCLDARIEAAWLSGTALGILAAQQAQTSQQ